MRFIADESVDNPIIDALRLKGHQVLSIAESSPGAPDSEVIERARSARAILITADKDFGELVYRQKTSPDGVILLRLAGLRPGAKAMGIGCMALSWSLRRAWSEFEGT